MEIRPDSDPIQIFSSWMIEAKQQATIREPTAMTLATLSPEGTLHARVVLCKGWSKDGFLFFTNYTSRKGLDLQHHPHAAAVFYWDPLFRQVKISGPVRQTTRPVSENYWNSRPQDSQLSQYISRQSQPAPPRADLEREHQLAKEKFKGHKIPCPTDWGGYLLEPKLIEFWIGRPGRLHDRYEFAKTSTLWTFRRLYP